MNHVKRYLGGHVSASGGLPNAVKRTLAIDANCMQIFAGSPRMWARKPYPSAMIQKFRQLIQQHHLGPVYIHALYLTNLASDKPDLVFKSKQALIMDMTNASAIGSAGVVLHIGSHQGRGWEVVREQVIREIKDVLTQTPSDSILILENTAGQKGKIGSLSELGEILSAIPSSRLKICLDTAHAFEAGHNLITPAGVDAWLDKVQANFNLSKLTVLHLNDSQTKLGSGRDVHANIGEGYIGIKGLTYLINHPLLRHLPLILEVPGTNKSGPNLENIHRVQDMLLVE